MKHEMSTLYTKRMLAATLKKKMEQKPLSKITVSEIITDCGVNRKTFYYHFADIYELLKWMLEQEAIDVVSQFDLLVDYADAMRFVIQYIGNNRHILNCAYDSMGRDEMKRFLYADFIKLISDIVDRVASGLQLDVDGAFKHFLSDFYTEALAGIIINLFRDNAPVPTEQLLCNVALTLREGIPAVLKGYAQGKAQQNSL